MSTSSDMSRPRKRGTTDSPAALPTGGLVAARSRWGNGMINVLLPLWLISLTIAFVLLPMRFCTIGNVPLGPDRATFAVVNAATLTGFSQEVGIRQLAIPGQCVLMLVSVSSAMIYLVLGALAVGRITRSRHSDGSLVAWSVLIYLCLVGIGLLAAWPSSTSTFNAFMLATSAAGNSGMTIGRLPAETDLRLLGMILPVGMIAGIGICPILDVIDRLTGRVRKLHPNTLTTLWLIGLIFLLGLVTLGLSAPLPADVENGTVSQWAVERSAMTLNAMGPGLGTTDLSDLPRAAQWIIAGLMLIGTGTGGLGGGLKVGTLSALFTGTRRCLAGQTPGRAFGIALVWTGCFVGGLITCCVLLIATQTHSPPDRLIIEAIASAGNTGLSFGNVGVIRSGLVLMSLLMLLGRMGGLLILWWMAETSPDAEVAVG